MVLVLDMGGVVKESYVMDNYNNQELLEYEEFKNLLQLKIKTGDEFYVELLKTVIDNPYRYCGLFRLSNAKTKLIQNVTQSNEIKFGDFMEDLITTYLSKLNYIILPKNLGVDENNDKLNVDQIFIKDNILYIVEQKIRDDHDSTKKRGQFQNFYKKIKLVRKKYPQYHFVAIMWFVDDSIIKNKNYYAEEIEKVKNEFDDTELHLYYGKYFFENLPNSENIWEEILKYLKKLRLENSNEIFSIPDFGNSVEIYKALLDLPSIIKLYLRLYNLLL